jgi:hypothetical protein
MKQLIVLIFITVVLYSCSNEATKETDKNNAQLDAPLSFKFIEETFEDKNGIISEDSAFSTMAFRYPIFEGGNENATKRMNEYIFSLTQNNSFGEAETIQSKIKSLKEIAKEFFMEAKDSAVPEYPHTGIWSHGFETDTLMLDQRQQILTLIHNYGIYTGGAHPNYFTQISNIDLATGDTLSYHSLFGNNKELLDAVEKRFIENEEKMMGEAGYEFKMEDYWFDEGFKLPQAMGITRGGIRCVYVPYEVASYARGSIDFIVPYADIPNFKIKK